MTDCVICQSRPADPDYGQCCPLCPSRLSRRLREIPGLVAELYALGYVQRDHRGLHGFPAVDANGRRLEHHDPVANALPSGPLNGSRGAPRVSGTGEAPVPIRIDPTDLTAPARPASTAVKLRGDWWRQAGGDPDQIGHLSVATELQTWARDWASERQEGEPDPQVPSLCSWLCDRLDWAIRHHPAVDEFERDVHRLHNALRGVLGDFPAPPKSMTEKCPACDGLGLIQCYPDDWIECGECGRILSSEEYAEYVRGLIDQEQQSRRRVTVKVYIVMVNDRHTDPEPTPFTDSGTAVDWARGVAQASATRPEDFVEEEIDGWLYHATYSVEGDSVWVVEKEMVTTAAKVKENVA